MGPRAHIVVKIIAYALGLLSLAAGVPKILQMPQELGFLSSIGFSPVVVSILGVVQVVGGVMLFFARSRLVGASLAALAFLVSAVAIFVGGNLTFGVISLLPVVLADIVVFFEVKAKKRNPEVA